MAYGDRHQRTEKPTAKKKREARERGQVARSADLGAFLSLLAGSLLLPLLVSDAKSHVLSVLARALQVASHPTPAGAVAVFESGLIGAAEVIVPVSSGFLLIAMAANLGQTGLVFAKKGLTPRFDRISPKAGLKRLFSPQGSITFLKQSVKLVLLGGLGYSALRGLIAAVPVSSPVALVSTVGIGGSRLLGFVRAVAVLGCLIGLGDFLYQKKHVNDDLKMTKQEVKDEAREREGDPLMKGQLRRRSYEIARSRVLQAVRRADVVVANPTHFSVALSYDRGSSPAPVVVAKGSDDLARRIKEVAVSANVTVVEDPPLARYLYATTEVGRQVPVEIYFAVARLLAFVFSLPPSLRGGPVTSLAHSSVPPVPEDKAERLEGIAALAGRAAS